MTIENTLRRAEVFLGLTDHELQTISGFPSSRIENYESGHFLFTAGSEAKYLYLLEEGQVDVIVEIPSIAEHVTNRITVDLMNKGSLLGWSALVRPHLYVLSTICQKPCKVAVISGKELLNLFQQDHNIGYTILTQHQDEN
jgi:CRP/FNR family transcriptional regulator, cyclic AMP receptor protein